MIEGVLSGSTGVAHLSIAKNGTVAYLPGEARGSRSESHLAVADRSGSVVRLPLAPGAFVHVRGSRDGKNVVLGSDDGKDAAVWVYALDGQSALRRLTLGRRARFPWRRTADGAT